MTQEAQRVRGGYEEGYAASTCFWGRQPGTLVVKYLADHDVTNISVLDLGCGEGKNAAALAARGAFVTAVDCSEAALTNGRRAFGSERINWVNSDCKNYAAEAKSFDLVIMYGLLHCLPGEVAIKRMIGRAIYLTRVGGFQIVATFNDGSHDLSAHPGFTPTLLPHSGYMSAFSHEKIVYHSDSILHETHPHNNIPHYHSVTRLIAQRR